VRPVEVAHRVILRSARGPLRSVWRAAYEIAVRAIAAALRGGQRDVSVYVAGSLGRDEAVYGLSDLDLIAVSPRDPARPGRRRERLARRRKRIQRVLPGAGELAPDVEVCEEEELRSALAHTVLTHGLDDPAHPANLLAETGWARVAGLQERPGIGRPLDAWRLVAGPDRRPSLPAPDADRRRTTAWLELQHWWRYAVGACLRPDAPRTPSVCVKLVSESVRTWLWIELGEAVVGRREALARGLAELPDEAPAIRRALALETALHRFPAAPLDDAIGVLARLSARVAARLQEAAAAAGATEVRLVGGAGGLALPGGTVPRQALPLADWRAVVAPRVPDEALLPRHGNLDDPRALAACARAATPGIHPVLRQGSLIVLPTADLHRDAQLRAVQCPVSDPVTFALLDGRGVAAFPALPGWSVHDVARRAVAEHAAWLRQPAPSARRYVRIEAPAPVATLARLLTAARAALLYGSLAAGEPTLALTVAATAELAEDDRLAAALQDARRALEEWHREGRPPSAESAVSELRAAVEDLAPYRSAPL
jgi:predicted nucleotidyltransferase